MYHCQHPKSPPSLKTLPKDPILRTHTHTSPMHLHSAQPLQSQATSSQHAPGGPPSSPVHHAQDEQAKRRQAERDFLELMQSIEESGSAAPGGGVALLASQRLGAMQVCVRRKGSMGAGNGACCEHAARICCQGHLLHVRVLVAIPTSM